MNSEEIREAFQKEFQSIQDARSRIHKDFVDHGLRFIEQRREFIKTLFLVSIGFVLTPEILDISHDSLFYHIGLGCFVAVSVISLLYLREYTDNDEMGVVELRNKSLAAINKRLGFAQNYLEKNELTGDDVKAYYQSWQSIPEIVELDEMTQKAEKNRLGRTVDYSTSFFMSVFVLGVFFLIISIFYTQAPALFVISSVVLIVLLTIKNIGMKILYFYSRLVDFLIK